MRQFIILCFLGLLVGYVSDVNAQRTIIVCIDPGHGGKDPGKPKGTKRLKDEKDLNLAIAKKLGNYIQERIQGAKVIYTRTTDKKVSLDDRVIFANKNKAHYFISIHCNSNPNKYVYGTKTHIHSHNFKASRALALRIEKEFRMRGGRRSRGIMSARDRGYNLFVLQYTDMPAVLVEAGFMSNTTEERYLNSERGQDLIASAIFRAFRDYVKKNYVPGDRDTVYKVQLMASKKQLEFKSKKLNDLGLRIVEHRASGAYAYKYMVGREYDKTGATKLLAEVKKAGFKDAFIVSMTNIESKKFRVVESK
ncbi:MAG: N-acetylmuramoyl-L-alanine amidase family protein [Flammeovirgaceae bacterium]